MVWTIPIGVVLGALAIPATIWVASLALVVLDGKGRVEQALLLYGLGAVVGGALAAWLFG